MRTRDGILLSAPLALFVCRKNTSTSIMAEAILRHLSGGSVRAASAGERPGNAVSLGALQCLDAHRVSTAGLYCKRWGEFFGIGRPQVRFLIALEDVYAVSAEWPPETLIARWYMTDPDRVPGSGPEIRDAFEVAFNTLRVRVQMFLSLPFDQLDDRDLTREMARIGAQ